MPSNFNCNGLLSKKIVRHSLFLFALIAFLSIIIMCLLSWENEAPSGQKDVCLRESCINSAVKIFKMIDREVDPCENFYIFACGNFIKTQEKTAASVFSLINNQTKLQIKSLLEKPPIYDNSRTLQLIKTLYNACMNISQIESETLPFLKKLFKELGGWPVIDSNWNEKKFDWKQVLYRLRRMGLNFDFFLKMLIDVDMKNSSKRILTITPPDISNVRNLTKGFNFSETLIYYDFAMKIVRLFGATELSASVEMKEVLEFEINLSKISFPYSSRGNLSLEYNPTTIKHLQEEIHSIPWLQLINNFLAPVEMLVSKDVINVSDPKFLKNLQDLLINTKKRILANYMFWCIVKHNLPHLPKKFQNQASEYLKIVQNVVNSESRWELCLNELDELHVALSSVYVRHFFNFRNKKAVAEIATYIKDTFIETLQNVSWMDNQTKRRAILKAAKINLFIAYTDELLHEDKIEDYYRGLELDPNNHYMKISLNISSFLRKAKVRQLKKNVSKNNWLSDCYTYFPKAFYNQKSNSLKVMAALIQDHFFDPERPQYMNFGSLGKVIAHEIIRGFDEEGKQFDENGNLRDWWTLETWKAYENKSHCLNELYGNVTAPEAGMDLNGITNSNGAFTLAYRSYQEWLKNNGEEPLLPGVIYTQNQIFWISAALNECGGGTFGDYKLLLPFMNFEEFARDFHCSQGTFMNPRKKCRVW